MGQDVNEKIIRELRTEIEELRAQLEKMKAQDAGGAGAQEDGKEPMTEEERAKMKKLEDMVSNLETAKHSVRPRCLSRRARGKGGPTSPLPCRCGSAAPPDAQGASDQTWEERERLSKLYEEERKKNLESEEKIRGVMQECALRFVLLPPA